MMDADEGVANMIKVSKWQEIADGLSDTHWDGDPLLVNSDYIVRYNGLVFTPRDDKPQLSPAALGIRGDE